MTAPRITSRPRVRFYEVDQQRVIYHMWYLAYFEDTRNDLLGEVGASLPALQDRGLDLQVVHADLDWHGPVRWREPLAIDASFHQVGRTSLTTVCSARVDRTVLVSGRLVHVLIDAATGAPEEWPDDLRHQLTGGTA